MSELTREQRLDRLDLMLAEGRIIRDSWTSGHGRACLLAALSPECGELKTSTVCPAWVMPTWLAALTPALDDRTSDEFWPQLLKRYALLARRWHVLTPETWRRLDYECRAFSVRAARPYATAKEWPAMDAVLALCDREALGEPVSTAEWHAARVTMCDAALYTSRYGTCDAACAASRNAREAARDAAYSAATLTAYLPGYTLATFTAAWDHFAITLLDSIERECNAKEQCDARDSPV